MFPNEEKRQFHLFFWINQLSKKLKKREINKPDHQESHQVLFLIEQDKIQVAQNNTNTFHHQFHNNLNQHISNLNDIEYIFKKKRGRREISYQHLHELQESDLKLVQVVMQHLTNEVQLPIHIHEVCIIKFLTESKHCLDFVKRATRS